MLLSQAGDEGRGWKGAISSVTNRVLDHATHADFGGEVENLNEEGCQPTAKCFVNGGREVHLAVGKGAHNASGV